MPRRPSARSAAPFSLALAFALALAVSVKSSVAAAAQATHAARVGEYLHSIAAHLPPPARAALQRIQSTPRQLLAMRAYLRAGQTLPSRWSWSEEQIRSFTSSPEYRDLIADIAVVQARFEAQNPGYSVYANTQVRSLDLQLQRWNENSSVRAIAVRLERAALRELSAPGYPARPDASAAARFAEFLRGWQPPAAAPLAAPGLSMHGRLRAVDFQVTRGDRIIAPTQIAAVVCVWERQGWGRKLALAAAGTSFRGPLRSPNEPWHYEYVPLARQVAHETHE